MKRQRGRGRKPGGGHYHGQNQHPNRTLESNGPEIKVRGPASHIYERYLQLARDAASSGDRVLSENYLQHADHYFRMVRSMQPAQPPPQPERFDGDMEGDDEGASENEAEAGEENEGNGGDAGEQPDVDFPQGQQPQQFERGGEGEFRRRRGRSRNRYREGERSEGVEGGERRERGEGERRERVEGETREGGAREGGAREGPRRERQPRDRDEDRDSNGPEGFSNGPKPAFLRGGD
jgi:hypothetical protein